MWQRGNLRQDITTQDESLDSIRRNPGDLVVGRYGEVEGKRGYEGAAARGLLESMSRGKVIESQEEEVDSNARGA